MSEISDARQDQIRVAARWWREVLVDTAMQDNGVRGVGAVAGTLLRERAQEELTADRLDAFELALSAFLAALIAGEAIQVGPYFTAKWLHGFSLNVDYEPELPLLYVAEQAGIPAGAFPWKTRMRLDEDRTEVRRGYDGEWTVIWAHGAITGQVASES